MSDSAALEVRLARAWLIAQAALGAAWWVAVWTVPWVRRWTLGSLPPGVLMGPDLAGYVALPLAVVALTAPGAPSRLARGLGGLALGWTWLVTLGMLGYGLSTRAAGWGVYAMGLASILTTAALATLWVGALPRRWFAAGPFRQAQADPGGDHLGRSLRQMAVFWVVFLGLAPLLAAWIEDRLRLRWEPLGAPGVRVAGVVIPVAASVLGVTACLALARTGRGTPLPAVGTNALVAVGPYRWVRNPMAVAGAAQAAGVGLALGAWTPAAGAAVGGLFWHVVIRVLEEDDLAARFGAAYADYRDAVGLWVPRRPQAGATAS